MATHSIPPAHTPGSLDPVRPLSRDEWWDLAFSLVGSARELYAEVGGAEAWIKAERAAWGEEAAH
jgi:hypothetical protein